VISTSNIWSERTTGTIKGGGRMPRVSVILAVYNGERFLSEAIDSILRQTFRDFEFLIVDDGSTDRTRDIIGSFRDSRVTVVRNERNLGLSRSLNRALVMARGEYIARQDADDVSDPDRFAEQVRYLDHHPRVALLGTGYRHVDSHGAVAGATVLPRDDLDIRWEMFFSCPFVNSSVMWRRVPVHEQVGRYNEQFAYAQDNELWLRIAERFDVANLGRSLIKYREHPSSMTSTYGEVKREAVWLWVEAVARALGWTGAASEHLTRWEAMVALLDGGRMKPLTPPEAFRAVEDIFGLHTWFLTAHEVDPACAAPRWKGLRGDIGIGLVRLARESVRCRHISEAGQLLAGAFRLDGPGVVARARRIAARRLRPRVLSRTD
jgi:glycosyltransferase involved in cell wall biosynthesis